MLAATHHTTQAPRPVLYDTADAADYIGLSVNTLNQWRCQRSGNLPYVKIGRLVRYRQRDLEAWLEARTVR